MPLLRFPLQSPGTAHYVYQFGQAVQQFPQQQQQQQQHPIYVLTYNVDQGQQHLVLTGPPSQQHQPQPSGSGNLLMPMYNVVNMPPPAQGAVSISTTPKHLQPPSVVTQTLMPMHTTHVQTQSQVALPAASPSPSITSLSTPGKLTGQSDSEPNVSHQMQIKLVPSLKMRSVCT